MISKEVKFFDIHTHIQDVRYDKDREVVIRRALDAGVGMIQVGTDFLMSEKALELSKFYNDIYATVGLHPTDNTGEVFDYEKYKKLAFSSEKVVAIGECGLDYFRITNEKEKKRQKNIFVEQIKLSQEVKKPLMIHCREAFADLIEILGKELSERLSTNGIIHFFSGSVEDAKKLLDFGFYFSFGGVITFACDYDEQIKFIPLDKILLETDAPYVSPIPYRGKRNEPLYVVETAKKLAEIKKITLDEVAQQTTKNAKKIFGV